ncbi:hypothetical protein LshimejAT787_1301520 [Lyophyllum shimeji]|uniref:Uncharacterized protein n=1 Tax=Lyophyllum shimeji TaxID=47721 RepID=A0A9P3PX64_LYOSH|nr:hypothetical protein LshimejAT787_1301520 [Lyophyllum shimeji]
MPFWELKQHVNPFTRPSSRYFEVRSDLNGWKQVNQSRKRHTAGDLILDELCTDNDTLIQCSDPPHFYETESRHVRQIRARRLNGGMGVGRGRRHRLRIEKLSSNGISTGALEAPPHAASISLTRSQSRHGPIYTGARIRHAVLSIRNGHAQDDITTASKSSGKHSSNFTHSSSLNRFQTTALFSIQSEQEPRSPPQEALMSAWKPPTGSCRRSLKRPEWTARVRIFQRRGHQVDPQRSHLVAGSQQSNDNLGSEHGKHAAD